MKHHHSAHNKLNAKQVKAERNCVLDIH